MLAGETSPIITFRQFQTQRHPATSHDHGRGCCFASFCSQLLSIAGAPALAFETSQELQIFILHGYCVSQIWCPHHSKLADQGCILVELHDNQDPRPSRWTLCTFLCPQIPQFSIVNKLSHISSSLSLSLSDVFWTLSSAGLLAHQAQDHATPQQQGLGTSQAREDGRVWEDGWWMCFNRMMDGHFGLLLLSKKTSPIPIEIHSLWKWDLC